MRFFNNITTIEELKQEFRKLAMANHPDKGGDTATMQSINTEYAFAFAKIGKGEFSEEELNSKITENEKYMDAINAVSGLYGIVIELVGNWLWATGNTYPVKSELKNAGFVFASKKKAWYFRTEEFKVRNFGRRYDLEEIKGKYGSKTIANNSKRSIAA